MPVGCVSTACAGVSPVWELLCPTGCPSAAAAKHPACVPCQVCVGVCAVSVASTGPQWVC